VTDVELRRSGGECVFSDSTGSALHCRAEVRLTDGRVLSTPEAPLEWDVVALAPSTFRLRVSFTNTTAEALAVEQLLPLVSETGFRSLSVTELLMSDTGWQSWTRAHAPRAFSPNAATSEPPIRSPILPHRERGSLVAGWMTVLCAPDGSACLAGFLSGREQTCVVEVAPRPHGHALRASAETEGVRLAPGARLVSEPLLLAFGTEAGLVARYAELVAELMRARVPDAVPAGWCSWYQFSTEVTEADVRRTVAELAEARACLPVNLIQLDDGYQREVGDWLDVKDSFPSGIGALMSTISEHRFTPGLWLAPFLLSARSSTYTEHPDWVVRDETTGQPLVAIENWGADIFALDTTHPAAIAWLEHVLRTMCEDWHVECLKLDFLYAAALRGRRFDPNLTGAQAYTRGLELVRRVAESRFLLGCGAPLVSSVGLVDGMRIGSDVAPHWNGPTGPATFNAVRATLTRAWMHRRWWLNDPDCVLARADTQLSEVEVRAWASVIALSGGMLVLGDELSQLDRTRRGWLTRLFPGHRERPESLPPLVDDAPEHVRLRVDRPWSSWTIVGLANWRDSPREVWFEPHAFGLPELAYHLVDLWSGQHLGPRLGPASIGTLAPHELRLLSVHAALDRPAVIGSTGHLLGEAMDVVAEAWDGATLRVLVAGGSARAGDLLVAVPRAWRHLTAATEPHLARPESGVLHVQFDPRSARELRLNFSPAGAGA
jgi:alpha-galactosidase